MALMTPQPGVINSSRHHNAARGPELLDLREQLDQAGGVGAAVDVGLELTDRLPQPLHQLPKTPLRSTGHGDTLSNVRSVFKSIPRLI